MDSAQGNFGSSSRRPRALATAARPSSASTPDLSPQRRQNGTMNASLSSLEERKKRRGERGRADRGPSPAGPFADPGKGKQSAPDAQVELPTLPALASSVDAALLSFKHAKRNRARPAIRATSPFASESSLLPREFLIPTRPSTAGSGLGEIVSTLVDVGQHADDHEPADDDDPIQALLTTPLPESQKFAGLINLNGLLFLESSASFQLDRLSTSSCGAILGELAMALEGYLGHPSLPPASSPEENAQIARFLPLYTEFLGLLRSRQKQLTAFLDQFVRMEEKLRVLSLDRDDANWIINELQRVHAAGLVKQGPPANLLAALDANHPTTSTSTAVSTSTTSQSHKSLQSDPLSLTASKSSSGWKFGVSTHREPHGQIAECDPLFAAARIVVDPALYSHSTVQSDPGPTTHDTASEAITKTADRGTQFDRVVDLHLLAHKGSGESPQMKDEGSEASVKWCDRGTECEAIERNWVAKGVHDTEMAKMREAADEFGSRTAAKIEELNAHLASLDSDRAKLTTELHAAREENEGLQLQLTRLASALADARTHLVQTSEVLAESGERNMGEVAGLKGRLREAEARIEELGSVVQKVKSAHAEKEDEVDALKYEMEGLKNEAQSAQDRVVELERLLAEEQRDREAAKQKIAELESTQPPKLGIRGRHATVGPARRGKKKTINPVPATLEEQISDYELPAPSDVATRACTPSGTQTPRKEEPKEPPQAPTSSAFAAAVARSRRSWSPPRMPAVEHVAAGKGPVHWGVKGTGEIHRAGLGDR